jgi:predicted enzyme related to lactoylglutathione lyase
MSGKVVHFEIPYDDGARARKFYGETFGWQLQEMPEMEYTLVVSGPSSDTGPSEAGFINGGMLAREESAATGPVVVIDVDSIDEKLTRIEQAGGTVVVPKQPVGPMGFTAYIKDPEGNVIGLWETAHQG